MLNCCENKMLNDATVWDKEMCKNVTDSYNFSQSTDFKITQSSKVLHHICLIQTLQRPQFRYNEFSSQIQHGNTSAVTIGVMIKIHPQDAYH